MLSNFDLPQRRNASAALPPFQTGRVSGPERSADLIYRFPGECGHAGVMGPSVPTVKADMSRDVAALFCETRAMSEWLGQQEFNDRFCARTARLRVERGWTQEQMATAIGIPHETYKKYETRSPMPIYLIPRFAMQVDREIEYLLTGRVVAPGRRGPRTLVRTGTDD